MIDLATAKQHLRVDHDADDALIGQYLAASIAAVENYTAKLLTRREVTQETSCLGYQEPLPLFFGPEAANVTISYEDSDGNDQQTSDVKVTQGKVYPSSSWPKISVNTSVLISYTAGYDDVPADLDSAVLVHLRAQYDEWRTGEKSDAADMAVKALCAPYRSLRV